MAAVGKLLNRLSVSQAYFLHCSKLKKNVNKKIQTFLGELLKTSES